MSRSAARSLFAAGGVALTVATALLLQGCAAHMSPRLADGSPDSCGLVVVFCVIDPNVRDFDQLRELTTGGIQLSDRLPVDAGVLVSLAAPERPIHSTRIANVLVFRNVPEGVYRIRSLLQERRFLDRDNRGRYEYYWERSIFAFDPGLARDLIFHVATGGLTYVGELVIRADFEVEVNDDQHRVNFVCAHDRVKYRIEPDELQEREVWATLLRWYRGTPWELPIEQRIQALAGRGD